MKPFLEKFKTPSNVIQGLLMPKIRHIEKEFNSIKSLAPKLALLYPFEPTWNNAVAMLKLIASEGAYCHTYTAEEVLLILHMRPQRPFLHIMKKDYNQEMELYEDCVAGAIMAVLKNEGREIDLPSTSDRAEFRKLAAGKIANEYIEFISKAD